jgi:hypothetical protein
VDYGHGVAGTASSPAVDGGEGGSPPAATSFARVHAHQHRRRPPRLRGALDRRAGEGRARLRGALDRRAGEGRAREADDDVLRQDAILSGCRLPRI